MIKCILVLSHEVVSFLTMCATSFIITEELLLIVIQNWKVYFSHYSRLILHIFWWKKILVPWNGFLSHYQLCLCMFHGFQSNYELCLYMVLIKYYFWALGQAVCSGHQWPTSGQLLCSNFFCKCPLVQGCGMLFILCWCINIKVALQYLRTDLFFGHDWEKIKVLCTVHAQQ